MSINKKGENNEENIKDNKVIKTTNKSKGKDIPAENNKKERNG